MRANYKIDKYGIRKEKMVLTKDQIKQALSEEWEERCDQVYTEVRNDVANQVMSVFFTALHKDFGFGKQRLLKLKSSVETWFSFMQTGIFGKDFTPIDCINYFREEFGIDLDEEELMK